MGRGQNVQGLTPQISAVCAWWGPIPQLTPQNPRNLGEGEIEVVGAKQNRVRLFGEAKWTKEPVGFAVLNHLRMISRFVPGADETAPFYLFGRTFDRRLRAAAKDEQLRLVDPESLYGTKES